MGVGGVIDAVDWQVDDQSYNVSQDSALLHQIALH